MAVVQYKFTHNSKNNTMKQNTQKSTYITIRIHKYNNTRYIIYKIKQKHTKHKYSIYTVIKNGIKRILKNMIIKKPI